MSTELTKDLSYYEEIVDRGIETFIEVGNALFEIRDQKLYADLYATFDDYTEFRFGFAKRRANQLIAAAKAMEELGTIVPDDELPTNELQARTLSAVAETPEEKAAIWNEVRSVAPKSESGEPQITAALIKEVAAEKASNPENLLEQLATGAPHTVIRPYHESKVIDELIGQLRKAVAKPVEIVEKLREAIEAKSKACGAFGTHRIFCLQKVDEFMGTYQADKLIADVMAIATKWESSKRQVDEQPATPKSVNSLKRS